MNSDHCFAPFDIAASDTGVSYLANTDLIVYFVTEFGFLLL